MAGAGRNEPAPAVKAAIADFLSDPQNNLGPGCSQPAWEEGLRPPA